MVGPSKLVGEQIPLFEGAISSQPAIPEGQSRLRGPRAPSLRAAVLGSGSAGNCVIVQAGESQLLIDAGFSCREIGRRLAVLGVAPHDLDGVVLTHEHGDHVRGVDVLARRYGLPVFATRGTLEAAARRGLSIRGHEVESGRPFEVGGVWVEAFGVPHDAREPIGLVVGDASDRRLGLVADLGARTQLAWGRLRDLSLLLLEANHDLEMLRSGPYPWHLKQRVAGRYGHLSNREAADGIKDLAGDRLEWVVLYHLSQANNLPALAADAIGAALVETGSSAELVISEQGQPTNWLEVT